MIHRQGTITHASAPGDLEVLNRGHVIEDIRVKLCFSNVQVQEFPIPNSYYSPAHHSYKDFTFNFDLEKKVLEQVKNSLLSIEAEQSAVQARQLPFLQNGVPTMLIPDRVQSASDITSTSVDNRALTQSLREFEGDNNDPFELVQLQTIDDMAELQSVLQPDSPLTSNTTSNPTMPYPPIATVAMVSHDAPLVDLSDGGTSHSELPVQNETDRKRPHVRPRHHISTPAVTASHSSDVTPPIPKPRVRSNVSPQKDAVPKPSITAGVRVLPPIPSSTNPPQPSLPSYFNVPVPATATKAPVLPSYEAAITSLPTATPPAVPSVAEYRLPDPIDSLPPQEIDEVKQIASMGFPKPRVARAYKRLKEQAKVLDFLVMVGSLEEYYSNGDSIETALLASDNDPTKAKDYLEKLKYYKELGFSEKKIHAAYEKANKDWDKTIDILVGDT